VYIRVAEKTSKEMGNVIVQSTNNIFLQRTEVLVGKYFL